jgi:aminoglycoside phosphotransferase (APT) family kinase protein
MSAMPAEVPTDEHVSLVLSDNLGETGRLTTLVDVSGERRVLSGKVDGRPVVVKAFARPVVDHMFRRQAMLAAAVSGCEVLRVPAPLLAHGRVLVLERLGGASYTQRADTPDAPAALHLAGRALAELHGVVVPLGDRATARSLTDHVAELVRPHPARLAATHRGWAPLIGQTLTYLRAADPAGDAPVALLHRDLHLRQLIDVDDRGEQVGIVDWDDLAAGDPMFDVAFLTTYLETHLASPGALTEAFLDGYATLAPRPTPQQLHPYRCFNLLRRACRRFRVQDAGWRPEMERMMGLLADAMGGTR